MVTERLNMCKIMQMLFRSLNTVNKAIYDQHTFQSEIILSLEKLNINHNYVS